MYKIDGADSNSNTGTTKEQLMITKDLCQNASDVRKNWSTTIDTVVHDRPAFINRTHDYVAMLNSQLLVDMLRDYKYHVTLETEDDGSVTGYVNDLQLVENAPSREECIKAVANGMKDYAVDYYAEFNYWSKAPNRVSHIPYVIKLLVSTDDMIYKDIVCLDGKN